MIPSKLIRAGESGFSLLELVAVSAIVLTLLALSVPAFISLKRGLDLGATASQVRSELEIARSAACAQNRALEVRFYVASDNAEEIRGLQIFVVAEDGKEPSAFRKIVRFPETVSASESTQYTTLLSYCGPLSHDDGGDFRAFRFLPNGTTDFPSSASITLTFVLSPDRARIDSLAPNYATIQIDPQNGASRIFRP